MQTPPHNFKVFCRVRSLPDPSLKPSKIDYLSSKSLCLTPSTDHSTSQIFEFDHIFFPGCSQEEVFRLCALPILEDLLQGFNGTILAYGQTSSGKTHTISGPDILDQASMGIIPRMISSLFDYIDADDENFEYTITVSYCELYLEKIYDLTSIDKKKGLKLRENKTQGVYVQGLSEHFVSSDFEIFEILRQGTSNKHVTSTKMNSRSSRSHTIFTLGVNVRNTIDSSGRSGKLCLADLAGSERVSKTGAEGKRLKEAKNINISLNALNQVIMSLSSAGSGHVPYRDSKLTRLLQESLGGNSKTALIITCSGAASDEQETVCTLKFGAVAKGVTNKPRVNREMTMTELKLRLMKIEKELRKKAEIIARLEEMLAKSNIPLPEAGGADDRNEDSVEVGSAETDEFLIALDEVSVKLAGVIEHNKVLRRECNELNRGREEAQLSNDNAECLKSMIDERNNKVLNAIQEKIELTQQLSIEKRVLTDNIENAQNRKLRLERELNEKVAECEDLKVKVKVFEDKQENPSDSQGQVEELKSQLRAEQRLFKKNEAELQELQFRLGLAIQDQTIEKRGEEREILSREIKSRNDKIKSLEEELEQIVESSRLAKRIVTEDQSTLNIRTDELEKQLDDLATMYKQIVSRQSSSNIDKQISLRKLGKINEKIRSFEEELALKKEELAKVEIEAARILDEMASQSIFNRVRVPIRGGGGKGHRTTGLSRLSIRPREYASMKFN